MRFKVHCVLVYVPDDSVPTSPVLQGNEICMCIIKALS